MRFLSATDNRLPRARPPRRPNDLAISDAFMTYILLSAKHKSNGQLRLIHSALSTLPSRAASPDDEPRFTEAAYGKRLDFEHA